MSVLALKQQNKFMDKQKIFDLIHAWQAIEETHGFLNNEGGPEDRMAISVIRKSWEAMDDLVRDMWEEMDRP